MKQHATLALIMALAMTGCQPAREVDNDGKTQVSVSLPVVGWFTERIGGTDFRVNVMIPQSADHDTYTPRPSQMLNLSESEAYLALGPLEFEQTWHDRLTAAAPSLRWMTLADCIQLLNGHCEHESADPHFWTSPRQAKTLACNIATALRSIRPEASSRIDSALTATLNDIATRDSAMAALAQAAPGKTFMIYHPALAYLCRDYGMRQIAIEHEGIAPTAATYARLTTEAREAGVGVVFVQKGYDNGRAETAARELGARIVPLAPDAPDWLATMDTIIASLR